jgi:hypothetical protein
MTTTVTCECGAVYERGEVKLPARDKDSFDCEVCKREIERWNGSRIPVFRLVRRPDEPPAGTMPLKSS